HEPEIRPELPCAAFVFMAEEAARAATMAVHVQGGLGVSSESASSAYLLRARGWPLAAGDPAASAARVAELYAGAKVAA
ncbi:MAG: acyl-CoA dehydrogenase, partial [Nocardia sp.]|nr:acyl-CoA dehydrogenase [Nocardia sp.]